MGSETHGDWKSNRVSESDFFDNFPKPEGKSIVKGSSRDDIRFIYDDMHKPIAYRKPMSLKVYSALLSVKNALARSFWYVYDGITKVLWCGELNKLYDELSAVRKERDEAAFRADMLEALLNIQKGKAEHRPEGQDPTMDEFNPWGDFEDVPKAKKKSKKAKKKAARRRR